MTPDELAADARVMASPSVYVRAFGAEIVLLDFARGEYFALDEIGAEIWRGLARGESLGQVADRLTGAWQVAPGDALQDVRELVSHLLNASLVSISC